MLRSQCESRYVTHLGNRALTPRGGNPTYSWATMSDKTLPPAA
jgi:hypothetical protein